MAGRLTVSVRSTARHPVMSGGLNKHAAAPEAEFSLFLMVEPSNVAMCPDPGKCNTAGCVEESAVSSSPLAMRLVACNCARLWPQVLHF